jgi:hypothetical protein
MLFLFYSIANASVAVRFYMVHISFKKKRLIGAAICSLQRIWMQAQSPHYNCLQSGNLIDNNNFEFNLKSGAHHVNIVTFLMLSTVFQNLIDQV